MQENIYLTAAGLFKILTEHYYMIQKKTDTARFTIPMIDIFIYLQEGAREPVSEMSNDTGLFQRVINAGRMIGYDCNGFSTCFFTMISDQEGKITTAYPGFSG